jgi:hypothetical protein
MGLSQQGQKRILVVDDEADLTMLCSLALEYHGFKVDAFTDPRKALSYYKPGYYDLIETVRFPLLKSLPPHTHIHCLYSPAIDELEIENCGGKYCRRGEYYFFTERLLFECCGTRLRASPTNREFKEKFRLNLLSRPSYSPYNRK